MYVCGGGGGGVIATFIKKIDEHVLGMPLTVLSKTLTTLFQCHIKAGQ